MLAVVRYIVVIFMFMSMLFGCIIPADKGISPISSVDLPNSQYTVRVYGPNSDGQYHYVIFGDNSRVSYGTHGLGPAIVDESFAPTIQEISTGVFRINWGEDQDTAYAIIDVKRGLIIEDSNPENERHFPFVNEP